MIRCRWAAVGSVAAVLVAASPLLVAEVVQPLLIWIGLNVYLMAGG